ncbi:aminomethyl-transferring glycine dehydrogenase subunit GcvPB [Carboxydothermus hydrogenoformans]|uniref:Probable glycine dehydrogenase (decarboxylating) subunit 2 n=1 Tax=Carboxydothermus hydrogenoformans (strain ATCC BAA-161 / DSM 6008 / Z-2901) TaxID=246194 RepID=Q3AET4_CARHZ|nr:aminomethyl-transferring glycine dehydrogenase subunit GcvPB [Carboxydothermus hydrogenoformans]ABB15172.1 glycine dehydrogenase (decarboxylating), subunit 2 [Carboxydothermus hydrogenoformans Z-2901]
MGSYPLIFELSKEGRTGFELPELDVPAKDINNLIPEEMQRKTEPDLPEVAEVDVVRHYVGLSRRNFGVDNGFYPLGSCTMKYNPKINEDTSRLAGFAELHPYVPEELAQGALELLYDAEQYLKEITGMDRFTFQPAAGAHGEFTGLMIIKAYLEKKGEKRTKVIVPDSAHGTNPATAAMCGFNVISIKSNERGLVDPEELAKVLDKEVAALMLTNPNTLGLFEEEIVKIAKMVHDVGGLLYYDGANLNAIMGVTRPGDMGFDVMHINLHKTFSTPHGGGGPGSGPVGVKAHLAEFLPVPVVEKDGDRYYFNYNLPNSIGKVRTFYGNFLVVVKAYTYLKALGGEGLTDVSQKAVLNANYLREKLKKYFYLPYDRLCKHEFVLSGKWQKEKGVRTLDIAKRLLDYGVHPPTIYFPLIVDEALMIEPTETESKETLDRFIEVMIAISREVEENPELLHEAPHVTPVKRLDEVGAARNPILRWSKDWQK